jgi:hypothetical protein
MMGRADNQAPRRVISKSPFGSYSYSHDGRYLYHTRNWDESRFTSYNDIFRYDFKKKKLDRLSERARLDDPAVSPDGYWVVAVQNGKGQSNLVKMRADGTQRKPLTTLTDRSQFSGPVWHPSGNFLAVSAWKDGSRDLYLVNPDTGKLTPLWRDRDVDMNPTWTPDGKYLVFSSDRTGVYNLYAYELATGKLFRMTNVMGGLFEPAVSPDMKTVAAASYDMKGFDIVTLPWDRKSWTPVPLPKPDPDLHQPLPVHPATAPAEPYNPWPSLRPKTWAPFALMDDRGPVLGFTTFGQDSLLKHYFYGAFGYGLLSRRPFYTLAYNNEVLYPSLYAYALDESYLINATGQGVTFNLGERAQYQGISATFPGLPSLFLQNNWVTGDAFSVGLNLANLSLVDPMPAQVPEDKRPVTGQSNSLSLTYKYGDNYKFAYSVSPEGGNLVTLGYEQGMPLLGSQHEFSRVWTDWRRYFQLPWQHHVFAIRALGGANTGSAAGDFYLGGFDSATYLSNVDLRTASSVGTRQLPLRGYFLGTDTGPNGFAVSAEYRFPLLDVQRGYSIYPVFIRKLHGAVFVDSGQAWKGPFDIHNTLTSVGAELRAQTYFMQAPTEVRAGIGQGLVATSSGYQWPAVYMDIGSFF